MGGKGNISDYRSKLDKTLASPELTNVEAVKTLVKKQIVQTSHFQLEEYLENVVERKSTEVSTFLNMLRSATNPSSKESHGGWKLKQDSEEFRVMYREGPQGTPFHTLLVEGYVDGPLDVCLCISWESGLYQKWWPQITIPTFKVISSQCVKRIRTGENVSLVRMKVSWPLSSREALIHYFAFEYFEDDLVVVLLNSISDAETINTETHGFTRDGIPDAEDVVRIDVVGGFALQKVAADRSFFRTIANMDLKLDFVPPTLINFISRQLVGSGFMLYKKEVSSVSKGDEKFLEVLKDSLYARIRKALYFEPNSMEFIEQEIPKGNTHIELEEQGDFSSENKFHSESVIASKTTDRSDIVRESINEIEEFEGASDLLHGHNQTSSWDLSSQLQRKSRADKEVDISHVVDHAIKTAHKNTENIMLGRKLVVSLEVEQALGTLEKIISVFRTDGSNRKCLFEPSKIRSTETASFEPGDDTDSHCYRQRESPSHSNGTSLCQKAPVLPDEKGPHSEQLVLHSSTNQRSESPVFQKAAESYLVKSDANNEGAKIKPKSRNKKPRHCCFHFIYGQ